MSENGGKSRWVFPQNSRRRPQIFCPRSKNIQFTVITKAKSLMVFFKKKNAIKPIVIKIVGNEFNS